MAESRRGQLRPKVIKVKLQDSVSVSSGSGNRDRPRSRSGGGSRGGGAGVTATVERTPPPAQVSAARQRQQSIGRDRAARGGGVGTSQTKREFDKDKAVSDFSERVRGFVEEGKNFLFGGIQSELSRGSGVVFTGSGKGAIVDPKTKELFEKTEQQITRDTVTEKLFSGRLSEIDPSDPRTQGQFIGLGALLALPVGGKGVSGLKSGIKTKVQKGKVSQLEKSLNLQGQSEKLGKDTFITGGGTESRPESLFITRFGKKDTVQEIKASSSPKELSPKDVTIIGKLDPTTQKAIKARQEGTFRFKSNLEEAKQRRVLQKGIFEGEVKQFATGQTTELKNILQKKPERIFSDIQKPKSLFAQTKAEKLEPKSATPRNVGTGTKTPFDTSFTTSGRSGKGEVFTQKGVQQVKQQATPTKPQPKQKGITATLFPTQAAQAEQQQVLRTPPKTRPPGQKQDFAVFPTITPIIDISPSRKLDSLTPSKLKIREDIKLDLRKGTATTPDTGLKIRDDVTFRQRQREKPKPKLGTPETPPVTILEPPPEIPPETPFTRIPLTPIIPPRFGAGGDGGGFGFSRRRKPFVGNTLETQIVGIFNKPEINVGRTRTFSQKKGKKKRPKIFGGGSGVSISGNGSKVKIF